MKHHLERIDASRNMFRYYAFDIQPNLFGEWTLVRRWGRIGGQGQARLDFFPTFNLAEHARERWRLKKERRGYRVRFIDSA